MVYQGAMKSAAYWIAKLGLQKHPEGGWYVETYRSSESVGRAGLPARFGGDRAMGTAIYFLLEAGQVSAWHRIRSDELCHFYAGDPLSVHWLDPAGGVARQVTLGPDPEAGQTFQAVVPAGAWFGARVVPPGAYALVGCTVAPGFDFADFELGRRAELLARFPEHRELIGMLARPDDVRA